MAHSIIKSSTLVSIAVTVWKVCPPIILLLGTFGNSMTLAIIRGFSASGGATQSIYVFLTALAVSDLVLLYAGLLRRWLQYMWKVDIRALHDVTCKLDVFLVYVSGMTSAWLLVSMTMQRVLSVIWPLRVGLMCTRRKTQVIVAVTVAVLALINWHFLANYAVMLNVNNFTSCKSNELNMILHEYGETVFSWIYLILTSGLPACLLLFSNTVLVCNVVQSARGSSALAPGLGKTNDNRGKAASALSVLLMSVSMAFLVLTLPLPMYMLVWQIMDPEWLELYVAVTNMMWYLNSAINFYVYCLTGTKFRSEFKRLVRGRVCTNQRKTSDRRSASVVAQNAVIAEGSSPSMSSTVMSLQT